MKLFVLYFPHWGVSSLTDHITMLAQTTDADSAFVKGENNMIYS